jgi:CheY-like chemotaxis protein
MNDNILIVEDEAIVAMDLEMKLQSRGYKNIYIAYSGEDAVKIAKLNNPSVILMDIKLQGDIDGIEAAKQILEYCQIPIIYVTGNSDHVSNERLLATNPYEVLIKPVAVWKLFEVIEKTIDHDKTN